MDFQTRNGFFALRMRNRSLFLSFFLLLLVVGLFCTPAYAQIVSKADSSTDKRIRVFIVHGNAGLSQPTGDLANDYGSYGEIGGGIHILNKRRWIFGLEGAYFFGNGVKKDPVPNLRNSDGTITGTNGSDAVFKVFQRATSFPVLRVGKVFPLSAKFSQRNLGGISVLAGGSWFRHWTYIQDLSKKTPQFTEDYRIGYDRLSGGPAAGFWIGYLSIPAYRKLNFHFEIGYQHAFTTTYRYDFAYSTPAGKKRSDGLFQLRFKICFTSKSRSEETVYYY